MAHLGLHPADGLLAVAVAVVTTEHRDPAAQAGMGAVVMGPQRSQMLVVMEQIILAEVEAAAHNKYRGLLLELTVAMVVQV
jgi:hypothetical protein